MLHDMRDLRDSDSFLVGLVREILESLIKEDDEMKWSEQNILKLRELCQAGKTNSEIADILHCSLSDVYAKRSQLGITIAKCKGMVPNPEFEKALEPIKSKGLKAGVRKKFQELFDEVLVTMDRDWTSVEDSKVYSELAEELIGLEAKYNAQIGR